MMGSRIACAVALILACAFAEPNVTALLDLVEVAAITRNATRLAAFEDALADVKAQRDVADDDEYIALLRSAASGNATALFHLAKFFCAPFGGAPPAPPRCERLLQSRVPERVGRRQEALGRPEAARVGEAEPGRDVARVDEVAEVIGLDGVEMQRRVGALQAHVVELVEAVAGRAIHEHGGALGMGWSLRCVDSGLVAAVRWEWEE